MVLYTTYMNVFYIVSCSAHHTQNDGRWMSSYISEDRHDERASNSIMAEQQGKHRTVMGVFFYVPNVIGYMRILLSIYSLAVAFTDYRTSVLCYALSFTCDYFDGFFARLCDQCSSFGAVLDMVTDRCSTAGLLIVLSHLYPQYMMLFMYLLILDFSSHWYHMYSSRGHHKLVSAERNFLLRFYYGCYPFFGFCCVGTELFYILLYVLYFDPKLLIPIINVPVMQLCYYVCLPACVCKIFTNLAQLFSAAHSIASEDVALANKTQ